MDTNVISNPPNNKSQKVFEGPYFLEGYVIHKHSSFADAKAATTFLISIMLLVQWMHHDATHEKSCDPHDATPCMVLWMVRVSKEK